ncbi:FAD-dependent oxidoreductase [Micromonospora inyonensis]|uniref:FAD-dependent oxidoreductase n=1 Tax=Micromonospora inyonensis TaxID=47866 RepID=UPI00159EFAA9|nr:FAD-dependent oxidoreductase [Micromonospora inyonensis]
MTVRFSFSTADRTPIYDRTEPEGYYLAIGTSDNQFKNAPAVGQMMTELINLEIDLGAFSRKRIRNTANSGTVMAEPELGRGVVSGRT